MANTLLANELNSNGSNGHKALDPIAELSLQRRTEQASSGGVFQWWFSRPVDGSEISPWWSPARDRDLRDFVMREGNDILQGAVGSMVKWGKTLSTVVEGPTRVASRYQETLANAEFGEGWGTFASKGLWDYYTQDKGWTIELIGDGDPDGPIRGPVLGLAHLDSQHVQPTGDIVYPILFNNPKDDRPHKIHATRVIRIVDMPSPNEGANGVGFCAVSRVIASSQVLLKLARYKNEKLSDMPEAGLLILNNILPKQWDDAQANSQRQRRKLGNEIWSNIMTLFSIDPAQPATATLTSFANLPEGFNELTSTNLYVNIVALAFGVDPREFWPVSSGRLGTSAESQVMNEKAEGKGKGDIIAAIERAINWKVLPNSVSFRFDFRDDQKDKLKADINSTKVASIMSMWKPEQVDKGIAPPVSALELRQMLADNVPDYFKPEFLEFDVTDEEELTDTERQDEKAPGVAKVAEKNYQEGLITLDNLIEFKLGKALDEKASEVEYQPTINLTMPQPILNISIPPIELPALPPIELKPQFNVPKQDAPTINVNVPKQPVTVTLPPYEEETIDIERDERGFITRAEKTRRRA